MVVPEAMTVFGDFPDKGFTLRTVVMKMDLRIANFRAYCLGDAFEKFGPVLFLLRRVHPTPIRCAGARCCI